MRKHGTLESWNDERGFGFIAPAQAGEKIFVHISAFPRDGQRPRVGELISFEIETGPEGKSRAMRVMRPGARSRNRQIAARPKRPARALSVILSMLAFGAIGAYAYERWSNSAAPESAAAVPLSPQPLAAPAFHCDGRTTCSQMTSCAEAKYFLQHCPHTTMDGNHDGVPCEQQWCQ